MLHMFQAKPEACWANRARPDRTRHARHNSNSDTERCEGGNTDNLQRAGCRWGLCLPLAELTRAHALPRLWPPAHRHKHQNNQHVRANTRAHTACGKNSRNIHGSRICAKAACDVCLNPAGRAAASTPEVTHNASPSNYKGALCGKVACGRKMLDTMSYRAGGT